MTVSARRSPSSRAAPMEKGNGTTSSSAIFSAVEPPDWNGQEKK